MAPVRPKIAIIGGGPAGLMAAQLLSRGNFAVTLYDAKPSFGRKFLLAGRGGLNLTHSEAPELFLTRYGASAPFFRDKLARFSAEMLRAWSKDLGMATFVGSSGRVFPESFKASPLLRTWLERLQNQGVVLKPGCRWQGFEISPEGAEGISKEQFGLAFRERSGKQFTAPADAVLLALGGASWPRMGSDGMWLSELQRMAVPCTAFQPSNCGFNVTWSEAFKERYAGTALKNLGLKAGEMEVKGEVMIADYGIEGGGVYALGRAIREELQNTAEARLYIDLKPGLDTTKIAKRLSAQRSKDSLSSRLRKSLRLPPAAAALLRECLNRETLSSPGELAHALKALPLVVTSSQPLERAISSAGGLALKAVNEDLMIRALPGVFAAGEMLDWDAPTGGYLLQGSFATAAWAADGIERWLTATPPALHENKDR